MRAVVAQSAGDAARCVGLFSDRRVCLTPLPVRTVLRTGRCIDTSPPVGFCREVERVGSSTLDRLTTCGADGSRQAACKQPPASEGK
jgi:hypothetical protein